MIAAVLSYQNRLTISGPIGNVVIAIFQREMPDIDYSCSPRLKIADISCEESRHGREGQLLAIICRSPAADAEAGPIRQPPGFLQTLPSAQVQSCQPIVANRAIGLRFGQRINDSSIAQPH